MTACGYTPAEARDLTLRDVGRLHAYWRKHPPVHILVAAFIGYKPPAEPVDGPQDFSELMAILPKRANDGR